MIRARLLSAAFALTLFSALPAQADPLDDCLNESDPKRQVAVCTEVIESGRWSGGDLASAYNIRGIAHRRLGQSGRAIEDYTEALRLDTIYAAAYNNRGNAYTDLGRYERAIRDFDLAIRLEPGYSAAYNNRGLAHGQLGMHEQAVSDFERALALYPGYRDARKNLATAQNNLAWEHYVAGRLSEALSLTDEAMQVLRGDPYVLGTRGHVLAAQGRIEEALAAFDQGMRAGNRAWIRLYQEALTNKGYDPGPADGSYGAKTRTALEACLAAGCRVVE